MRSIGTYDASDVAIDQLTIACDRSLDEPGPFLRVAGATKDGDPSFALWALTVDRRALREIVLALEARWEGWLEQGRTPQLIDEVRELGVRVQVALTEVERFERVTQTIGLLAQGERLVLVDEGGTTILCLCEHPAVYEIHRWGSDRGDLIGLGHAPASRPVGQRASAAQAAALALYDEGLPFTERVLRDVLLVDNGVGRIVDAAIAQEAAAALREYAEELVGRSHSDSTIAQADRLHDLAAAIGPH